MIVEETKLPGVKLIEPVIHGDSRGFFFESYNKKRYTEEAGIDVEFLQDNTSSSAQWVLRGLHRQLEHPQGKLIWLTSGRVFDVVVDVDSDSDTYCQWLGFYLSGEDKKQLYVPPGYAHGFLVLSERAEFCYKCTDLYYPDLQDGFLWNDPAFNIDWPLGDTAPILSAQDQAWPAVRT